ncbi:pseudouridine synthase [Herbidospora galbida]|uniref:Pseudouridine synthase n=1 Tax=Herbidospora galbida TaxID=2575442 RepID=A0A4U3MAE4_9ACTN|nr:pseudouridine synthase [Herbidospora galbida]TKK86098.1 pseudouridine synthase [Herbidospora galbida]
MNKRSTPSGDGRGRGNSFRAGRSGSRGAGSGGPAKRGGFGGGSSGGGSGSRDDRGGRDFRPRDDRAPRGDRSYGSRDDRPQRSSRDDSPRSGSYGDRPQRSYGDDRPARSYGDRPQRPSGDDRPARSYGDRPQRSYGGDRPARSYGDRPQRSSGDDRPARSYGDRPQRSYGDDRPARSYGDRPQRSSGDDRPARSYGDRPARSYGDDRPARSYGDRPQRSSGGDRPQRSFRDDRPSGGDRPQRSGGSYGDRPQRAGGSYGDRPQRAGGSYGDRPQRAGGSYGDRPVRPERSFRDDNPGRSERSFESRDDRGNPAAKGTRARFGKADRPMRADRGGRRDDVQTVGKPARPKAAAQPFKTAAQPKRDPDFWEPGYTDERDTTEIPGGERLQKVLAQAGVASRRACEDMIGEGRVTVDGQVVRRFGARVDPAKQIIHVDGKRIPTAPDLVYYALNKPIGVVSTMEDPEGRPCLADYVQELAPRLFHVGRLDTETEGLLLLTNDGELAHRLTHPSYGVPKKYWAKVPGPIPRDLHRTLRKGIELEDGLAKVDSFTVVQEHGQQALVEVVLHEGRKHIVRRLLEETGHRVIDLARIEFGPVKLGRLKPGTIRALSLHEVGELYASVKL